MSDDLAADSGSGGVSPLRKKISAGILGVLVIVLLVEARAGLGHMLTGQALQAKSPDGAFQNTTMDELQSLLSLAPSRTIAWETEQEVEYRYSWFSLLRPLLNRPEAAFYVAASQATPAYALRFNTERPDETELNRRPPEGDADSASEMAGAGMGGAGGGGAGPGGSGAGGAGSGGGDFGPAPQDPAMALLDKDGDGARKGDRVVGTDAD